MAFLLLPFLLACTSFSELNTHQAVFTAPYTLVWQSTLLAMRPYPLQNENLESGRVVTKDIKGYSAWTPPLGAIKNQKNRRYKIKVFLERGAKGSKEATKIHVVKEEFINKDFIQHSIPVASNGLEEEVILYRIHREVLLEQKRKAFHKEKEERVQEPSE